jgi:hypothetical protein
MLLIGHQTAGRSLLVVAVSWLLNDALLRSLVVTHRNSKVLVWTINYNAQKIDDEVC